MESLEALILQAMEAVKLDLYSALPCIVHQVNTSEGLVDCIPAVKRITKDGEAVEFPVIPDVPVASISVGNVQISVNIEKGDEGILIFMDRDSSVFIEKGEISEPIVHRKHDLSDAVFLPYAISNGKRLPIPSDGVQVDVGDTAFAVTSSGVEVTGDLDITGDVSATGDVVAGGISLRNHTHIDSQGGTTSPPQ